MFTFVGVIGERNKGVRTNENERRNEREKMK